MEIKSVFFSDIPNMEKIQEFASLIIDLLFPNYYHEINNIDLLKKTVIFILVIIYVMIWKKKITFLTC